MNSSLRSPARFIPVVILGLAATASAAEPSPAVRPLVDFENPAAISLHPERARGEIVRADKNGADKNDADKNDVINNAVLEIETEPGADFPKVRITPADGPWNLTGYEAVAVDVHNPQDEPVRVLASANNPNTDGVNHCSTASTTIGAGEKAVLIVPLGKWHDQPKPLDFANIASFDVLLDRPGRSHRFTVDNFRAVRTERFDAAKASTNPFFQSLAPGGPLNLGRGINLGNALDAPREGEWGVTLQENYFQAIKDAGFETIRLPVKWSAHAEQSPPYTIDAKFFGRIDWAIDQALSRGLNLVLDVHHYSEMDERPDEHRARLVAVWEQIAARYRDKPPALKFELLNEPHDRLTAGKWNAILADTLAVVRKTNPTRQIVVGPVAWNGISELKSLELPEDDRNLIVTVHYYGPFAFTHQGAHWLDAKSRPPMGKRWTGTEEERREITREFDMAAQWGLANRRPIFLGEFGAINMADMESRARWTKFIADAAAERRMGWAYWEFCSGFGAYDPGRNAWIEPLRNALVPPPAK
jgi:aryl-phospho-beta-D-glucosidase BglC (GH1 family)